MAEDSSGQDSREHMAKSFVTVTSPSEDSPSSSSSLTVSKGVVDKIHGFFTDVGVTSCIPKNKQSEDFYSNILSNLLKADHVQSGRISCSFSVLPFVANYFGGLHGGALAAIAERVAIACARTVVAEDKEIFLGELSLSYLSAAPKNEELVVDSSVLRSGKNLTVVAMEFKIKKTGKLAFTARATFYNMPVAKL
ncbi:acyl-coenzyme A thioesterase 13 isoform X1 [Ricinus communis]|uniref:acyl-coenzyme A thioesterase 13 isoform X1 n=2 Tax=Ricinus communis TaxID=3988 RepID=UPI00201A3E67|nr:acyl-coenzyme A thioesterase 13 isoform X1 [Ricinus communis]XP_048229627.1 acyl-coenzyme A thioesterase 13 isoform X1 [Ricinus communis]XP_048229630.1 acyl-coenzyme A thioesterase 13 isoform X1 [Ricinus communis]